MQREWFKPLLDKLVNSYSARIIVIDECRYSQHPEVDAALKRHFVVHYYKSELELRSFLMQNSASRTLIIKLPEVSYLPFDIEQSSEIIYWREADLVPATVRTEKGERMSKEESGFLFDVYGSANELEQLLNEEPIPWGKASYLWGKLSFLKDRFYYDTVYSNNISTPGVERLLKDLEAKLKEKFTYFITSHYRNLFYQSIFYEPVTVDRVLPFCAHRDSGKLALICMDGMGFQEWFCLKNYFLSRGISNFKEMYVFALIPTVTRISRRALFSGKKSLADLPGEEKGFREYVRQNMANAKGTAQFFVDKHLQLQPEYFASNYVGIVFSLIDDLAHSIHVLGEDKALMQQNLEVILRKTEFAEIIKRFLEEGYKVILTSDHGSVYSSGIGIKQDKYLMDERAKRACLFPNKRLAEDFMKRDERLLFYENEELLGKSCAVFAPWRGMFGSLNEKEISHGGIHLEEVVVPFVEVLMLI